MSGSEPPVPHGENSDNSSDSYSQTDNLKTLDDPVQTRPDQTECSPEVTTQQAESTRQDSADCSDSIPVGSKRRNSDESDLIPLKHQKCTTKSDNDGGLEDPSSSRSETTTSAVCSLIDEVKPLDKKLDSSSGSGNQTDKLNTLDDPLQTLANQTECSPGGTIQQAESMQENSSDATTVGSKHRNSDESDLMPLKDQKCTMIDNDGGLEDPALSLSENTISVVCSLTDEVQTLDNKLDSSCGSDSQTDKIKTLDDPVRTQPDRTECRPSPEVTTQQAAESTQQDRDCPDSITVGSKRNSDESDLMPVKRQKCTTIDNDGGLEDSSSSRSENTTSVVCSLTDEVQTLDDKLDNSCGSDSQTDKLKTLDDPMQTQANQTKFSPIGPIQQADSSDCSGASPVGSKRNSDESDLMPLKDQKCTTIDGGLEDPSLSSSENTISTICILINILKTLDDDRTLLDLVYKASAMNIQISKYIARLEFNGVSASFSREAKLKFISEQTAWSKSKRRNLEMAAERLHKCEDSLVYDYLMPLRQDLPADLFHRVRLLINAPHSQSGSKLSAQPNHRTAGGPNESILCSLLMELATLDDTTIVPLVRKAAALQERISHLSHQLELNDISPLLSRDLKLEFIKQHEMWSSLKKSCLETAVEELCKHEEIVTRDCIQPLIPLLPADMLYRVLHYIYSLNDYHGSELLTKPFQNVVTYDCLVAESGSTNHSDLPVGLADSSNEIMELSLQADLEERENPTIVSLVHNAAMLHNQISIACPLQNHADGVNCLDPKPLPVSESNSVNDGELPLGRAVNSNERMESGLRADLEALGDSTIIPLVFNAAVLHDQISLLKAQLESHGLNTKHSRYLKLQFIEGQSNFSNLQKNTLKKVAEELARYEESISKNCNRPLRNLLPGDLFDRVNKYINTPDGRSSNVGLLPTYAHNTLSPAPLPESKCRATNDNELPPLHREKSKETMDNGLLEDLTALGNVTVLPLIYKAAAMQQSIIWLKGELESNYVNTKFSLFLKLRFIEEQTQWSRKKKHGLKMAADELGKYEERITSEFMKPLQQLMPLELFDRVHQYITKLDNNSVTKPSLQSNWDFNLGEFGYKSSPCSKNKETEGSGLPTPETEMVSESVVFSQLENLVVLKDPTTFTLIQRAFALHQEINLIVSRLKAKFGDESLLGKSENKTRRTLVVQIHEYEEDRKNECIGPLCQMLPDDMYDRIYQFLSSPSKAFKVFSQLLKSMIAYPELMHMTVALDDAAVLELLDRADSLQKHFIPWKRFLEFNGCYQPISKLPSLRLKRLYIMNQMKLKGWDSQKHFKLQRAVEEIHTYDTRIINDCYVPLSRLLLSESFDTVRSRIDAKWDNEKIEDSSDSRPPECPEQSTGKDSPDLKCFADDDSSTDSVVVVFQSEKAVNYASAESLSDIGLQKAAPLDSPAVSKLVVLTKELHKHVVSVNKSLPYDVSNLPSWKSKLKFLCRQMDVSSYNFERKKTLKKTIMEVQNYESRMASECLVPLSHMLSPELFNQVYDSIFANES